MEGERESGREEESQRGLRFRFNEEDDEDDTVPDPNNVG